MKLNLLFLMIGIILSVISKTMQFVYKSKIGDLVVIPAAIFFVLAVLFSIGKFANLANQENGTQQIVFMAFFACLAVVSFQVMMILLMGHQNKWGFAFLVPFMLSAAVFAKKWISTFHQG